MSRRLASCLLALLTGCAKQAARTPQNPQPAAHASTSSLRYVGSSTIALGAMPELVAAFSASAGIEFSEVKSSNSLEGFKAAMAGETPIAGMSRGLSPAEQAGNPFVQIIGYDAIGIFVNARNPISSLTKAQVKALFSGAATDWKAVGGSRGPVELVTEGKDGHRPTIQFFQDSVLAGGPFGKTREIELPLDDVRYVVEHAEAITFASSVFWQRGSKLVGIDGVSPSEWSIRAGEYPLVRPLLLVSKTPPQGDAKAFFDFVLSPAGQAIIGRRFVPRTRVQGISQR